MIRGLICLLGLQASVFAMNWNEVLESHHELFSDKSVVQNNTKLLANRKRQPLSIQGLKRYLFVRIMKS